MKIALYKSVAHGIVGPQDLGEDGKCWADHSASYIRVSESVDVSFPPIDRAEITAKEVALLDKQADEIRSAAAVQLQRIEARKQELMALTHESV